MQLIFVHILPMPNHVSRLARLVVCHQKIDSLLLSINVKQIGLLEISRDPNLRAEASLRHIKLLLCSAEEATIALKAQVEETIDVERAEALKQVQRNISLLIEHKVSAFANVIANAEVHLLTSQTILRNVDDDIKALVITE